LLLLLLPWLLRLLLLPWLLRLLLLPWLLRLLLLLVKVLLLWTMQRLSMLRHTIRGHQLLLLPGLSLWLVEAVTLLLGQVLLLIHVDLLLRCLGQMLLVVHVSLLLRCQLLLLAVLVACALLLIPVTHSSMLTVLHWCLSTSWLQPLKVSSGRSCVGSGKQLRLDLLQRQRPLLPHLLLLLLQQPLLIVVNDFRLQLHKGTRDLLQVQLQLFDATGPVFAVKHPLHGLKQPCDSLQYMTQYRTCRAVHQIPLQTVQHLHAG
jgi:hypothetical protein